MGTSERAESVFLFLDLEVLPFFNTDMLLCSNPPNTVKNSASWDMQDRDDPLPSARWKVK